MDKKEREEAKQTLAEINKALEDETLSDEQREELEIHAAGLSGALLSVWLPVDWGRRLIMIGIVAFGLYEAIGGNYQALIWWLLLPFFSPRITGEVVHFTGRVFGSLRGREG